jgi:hypothetical protein
MEAAIVGGILGLGYLLATKNDNDEKRSPIFANTSLGLNDFSKTTPSAPLRGDIPLRGTGRMIESKSSPTPVYVENLAGQTIQEDRFYHNNMVPYFGGTVKQNISANANKTILDYHTGAGSVDIEKREQPQFFNRERMNIGTPFGAENTTDEQRQYYRDTGKRHNEVPFNPIRVGPGLADGYTNIPSGGVHQGIGQDVARRRYKTVNELRPGNKPKETYAGVILNPEQHIKSRGDVGEVKHRHPDKFFVNENGERNLVTTGAYIAHRVYPEPIDREVQRPSTTKEYFGVAEGDTKSYNRAAVKKTHRQALDPFNLGPANTNENGGLPGDYGAEGYEVLPNQRTQTGTRTKFGIASGGRYAGVTAFQDDARYTRKMNFEGPAREFGNAETTGPGGLPVYDPNEIARGTIRQQTEDNDWIAPAKSEVERGVDYTYMNNAKTNPNREDLAETNWIAPPKSDVEREKDYTYMMNARTNPNKERIAQGRQPTPQGTKLASGKQAVRIRTKKIEDDYMNHYTRPPTNVISPTTSRNVFGATNIRPKLGQSIHLERSHPGFLQPLVSNPYTQSTAWHLQGQRQSQSA